jgi:hypothetical protein
MPPMLVCTWFATAAALPAHAKERGAGGGTLGRDGSSK